MSIFGPSVFFFLLPFVQLVALAGLVALVVVAARRRRPDPRGRRPYAIYLFSVIFVCVFTILVSVGMVGAALAQTVTDESVLGSESCVQTLEGFPLRVAPMNSARIRAVETPAQFSSAPIPSLVPRQLPPEIQPVAPEDFNQDDFPPRPITRCEPTTSASSVALGSLLVALSAGAVLVGHVRHAQNLITKERLDDRT